MEKTAICKLARFLLGAKPCGLLGTKTAKTQSMFRAKGHSFSNRQRFEVSTALELMVTFTFEAEMTGGIF
jgi:hypothetical protein